MVSESFNYVAEFVRFVTEGYVATFALNELGLESLDEPADLTMDDLHDAAQSIVEKIWDPITISEDDVDGGEKFCFCQKGI